MHWTAQPDGRKRELKAAYVPQTHSTYRIGEMVPGQAAPSAAVAAIMRLGGAPGNLRICFENGTQLHVGNAVEIWEPVGEGDTHAE